MIADPRQRQAALDALGTKLGWRRGPFRSWKVRGYTVSVAAKGYPRPYLAVGRHETRRFDRIEDLQRFVLTRRVRRN